MKYILQYYRVCNILTIVQCTVSDFISNNSAGLIYGTRAEFAVVIFRKVMF